MKTEFARFQDDDSGEDSLALTRSYFWPNRILLSVWDHRQVTISLSRAEARKLAKGLLKFADEHKAKKGGGR